MVNRDVAEDIVVDAGEDGRIAVIEILDTSRRLDLATLGTSNSAR